MKGVNFMNKIVIICAILLIIFCASSFLNNALLSEEREIYDKTLRLHIPACSDSDADQEAKLKVRDAVLELLNEPLSECKTKEQSIKIIQQMSNDIQYTANKVLAENNLDYTATVTLTNEYYPRKAYNDFTLPAGNYTSLKIELGQAEGKNWWCVLFPQVCLGTAKSSETLAEVGFTANQIRLLTEQEESDYVVKFKIVEILESIFG